MNDQGRTKALFSFDTIRNLLGGKPPHKELSKSRVEKETEATTDYSFDSGPLVLRKSADNRYYLFCFYSNKYRDIDAGAAPHKGGEIISDAAHRDYMKWLDENPALAPELWSLHIPGTARTSRAHWWDYDGNFAMAEFQLTEDEAKGIALFAKSYTPGLSHGFEVLGYDPEGAVIEGYRTHEISILPLEWAANPWTTVEMIRKELDVKLSPEKRAALVLLHGEARVTELEAKGMNGQALLAALGIESKEVDPPADVAETPATALPTEEDFIAALKALNDAHNKDLEVLIARVGDLETRLAAFEDQNKSAIAAAMPPSMLASWKPISIVGAEKATVKSGDKVRNAEPVTHNGHTMAGFVNSLYRNGGENDEN